MKEKCNRYESLFIFGNEDELHRHIKNCPDCKSEHEKMNNISNLVKEAKPLFIKQTKSRIAALKIAAAILLVCAASFAIFQNFNRQEVQISYNVDTSLLKEDSYIAQLGLPTDEYGLLAVE